MSPPIARMRSTVSAEHRNRAEEHDRSTAAPVVAATAPPAWIPDLFGLIDAKRFDSPFAAFTDDAHLRFGVHAVRGGDQIVATLKAADSDLDTAHRVPGYRDRGPVRFLRGGMTMTGHDGSAPQAPASRQTRARLARKPQARSRTQALRQKNFRMPA